jgi:hypothetical protein
MPLIRSRESCRIVACSVQFSTENTTIDPCHSKLSTKESARSFAMCSPSQRSERSNGAEASANWECGGGRRGKPKRIEALNGRAARHGQSRRMQASTELSSTKLASAASRQHDRGAAKGTPCLGTQRIYARRLAVAVARGRYIIHMDAHLATDATGRLSAEEVSANFVRRTRFGKGSTRVTRRGSSSIPSRLATTAVGR